LNIHARSGILGHPLFPVTTAEFVAHQHNRELTEPAMKRSSKVILLFMGSAAAGSISMATTPANAACARPRPGFVIRGYNELHTARCMTRAGFGGSSHHFAGHFHSRGG
jgi:hypothetical protein